MRPRAAALLLVLLAFGCALAACGGGGEEEAEEAPAETAAAETGGGGGGATLQLAADPGGALKFDKTSLEAPAGKVTIELTNDSSLPHNVLIEGNGVDEESDTVTGATTSLSVELQPGEYTFYCSVPGHREGGMEGTLTVK